MKKEFKNLTVDNLIKTDWFNQFNRNQKRQILLGIENNLEVSLYAKQENKGYQMREIRLGLQNSLDVSVYAKPEIDFKEMKKIRLELLKKIKKNVDKQKK